jgi:hypothetical protein
MLRSHEILIPNEDEMLLVGADPSERILAAGSFRVVLTDNYKVFAMVDAPDTVLGPLKLAVELERRLPSDMVGFNLKSIGRAVSRAAESTFKTASNAASSVAKPVFKIATTAASDGVRAVAQQASALPAVARRQVEAASRVVLRARLGDVNAKNFIKGVVNAAKSGAEGARKAADALVTGTRLVARAVDLPVHIARAMPGGIGNTVASISPLQRFDKTMHAVQRGDFDAVKRIVREDIGIAQGVVSLVPGIGTGISAGLSAGLAALEGGSPLELAVRTAYGAIPIPVGIRSITDAVLDGVIALAKGGANVSEMALTVARERIPRGLPRDVFDTLVRIVIRRVPIQRAGEALVNHYVKQYGGVVANQALSRVTPVLPALPALPNSVDGRLLRPLLLPR